MPHKIGFIHLHIYNLVYDYNFTFEVSTFNYASKLQYLSDPGDSLYFSRMLTSRVFLWYILSFCVFLFV